MYHCIDLDRKKTNTLTVSSTSHKVLGNAAYVKMRLQSTVIIMVIITVIIITIH